MIFSPCILPSVGELSVLMPLQTARYSSSNAMLAPALENGGVHSRAPFMSALCPVHPETAELVE